MGGKFEKGETALEAAQREAFEETGLILDNFIFLNSKLVTWHNQKYQCYLFKAEYVSGEPLGIEHSEFQWVHLKDIEKYPVLDYSIKDLKEYLK